MTPEISEFSYGFALTNELVGWAQLRTAPIFPNLVEEGRTGGGYDVRLDMPGIPMYLQFKRSDCMKTRNAKEIKSGANLSTPYYGFHLMDGAMSDQHRLLLRLDNGTNEVYYAAPRFHRFSEINSAWNANAVATRSIFVTPRQIGRLSLGTHSIAYDHRRTYCCSDPREVEFLDNEGLLRTLTLRLRQEKHSLEEQLPHLLNGAKIAAKPIEDSEYEVEGAALQRALPVVKTRTPRVLTPPEQQLRELSDIAARIFGTQLIVDQTA